jgi:hypothetical protein
MYIDPYAKPRFLHSREFYGFMRKEWEANKKEGDSHRTNRDQELWDKLVSAPWTTTEHPNIAQWLKERSPVLDLFGVAVRKPNFVCWRWRPEGSVIEILLPDVQSQRSFGRDLSIRITERLGRGDIDGAWYDVMSMFYLSQKHYIHDPVLVLNLVGIAIDGMGWDAAKQVLHNDKTTPEQLEHFANELEALPRKMVLDTEIFEKKVVYSLLRHHSAYQAPLVKLVASNGNNNDVRGIGLELPFKYLSYLPIDYNIAGKRIAELNSIERRKSGDSSWDINSTVMKKNSGYRDAFIWEKQRRLTSLFNLFRIPLIYTRSQLLADHLICTYAPAFSAAQGAIDRSNTQFSLLRVAVALERYRVANDKYPAVLDELVPTYLDDVPLDPYTGRLTLQYKPEPKDGKPFALYSLGPNGIDDGGTPKAPEGKPWSEHDMVW